MHHQSASASYTPNAPSVEQYELSDQVQGHSIHDEALHSGDHTSSKAQSVTTTTAPTSITKPTLADIESQRSSPFKLAADAFSVLIPLLLLGFMIAINRIHGDEVDRAAFAAWEDTINVLATLFPIIFASIVGRLVLEAACWKLEAGSTMQVLEQLLGSRSVGSVITTQLQLQVVNLLGISLLLLWALSPLGSQSLLRILSSNLQPRKTMSEILHCDNLHASGLASVAAVSAKSAEEANLYFEYLTILFSATLMTPVTSKTSPMDQWSSVKIPFLDTEAFRSRDTAEQWQNITADNGLEQYVSVAGIPVTDIPYGNTTFSVESNYIELDCFNVSKTIGDFPDMGIEWPASSAPGLFNFTKGTWQGVKRESTNDTFDTYPPWSLALDNFIDYYWINMTAQAARHGLDWSTSVYDNGPELFMEEPGIEARP